MASSPKAHARTSSALASPDDNPQTLVIASLRNQVGDLVSQVTQLNSKLVQSYDRISDLEDNMHIASSNLRNSTLKISQLELERTQHLSALNTGLLVEKSHVTSELTRLMERATEESSRRGLAESARQEIEKDLDDLSAELFDRANTMVAEARLAQAKSEHRVQDTEATLRETEDAVMSMKAELQVLQEEKERNDRELSDMRELMGKGKWVERARPGSALTLRLLSTHAPYQEFLLFVAHLRQIRPGTPQSPPMATLLPLPFLARLVLEDSDPTLRLDAAPALNWLTRRAVNAAIHHSQLIIDPVSASTLLEAQAPPASAAAIAAFSSQVMTSPTANVGVITCALCGTPVLPPSPGSANAALPSTSSWRSALFSRTASAPAAGSSQIHSPTPSVATSSSLYPPSASSRLSPPPTPPPLAQSQIQVQAFSVPATGGSGPSALYPLCSSGWCLARLRTTCEVWRFISRGIVDKVWAEEVPGALLEQKPGSGAKPPVPPRRRMNVGKLIGMALGKASGKDAAASGSGGEEKFSPAPRRVSGERRRMSVGPTTPPPPVPRRSETRGVRFEGKRGSKEIQKEKKEVSTEQETHVGAPVEGATLFDVDSPKLDEHPPTAHARASSELKDDPLVVPTPIPDPTQIPLPTSPAFPPERVDPPSESNTQPPTEEKTQKDEGAGEGSSQLTGTTPPAEANTQASPGDEASAKPSAATSLQGPTSAPAAAAPTPSPTASPAPPPPVPRRAPRRAAPVPPGGGAGAKPPAETVLANGDAHKADGPSTPTAASSPAQPTPPLGSPSPSQTVHPSTEPDTKASAPSTSGDATSQPPPGGRDAEPAAEAAKPAVETAKHAVETAEPAVETVKPAVETAKPAVETALPNGDAPNASVPSTPKAASSFPQEVQPSPESESRAPPPPPPRDTSPHRTPRDSSPSRAPEEQEAYIGDVTWEERTWKELVRMREDMFYARIGTAR